MHRHRPVKKEKDRSERWLITYADMITLLMIFFIVMYALSKVDVAKFKTLAESMAAEFGAGDILLENPGPAVVPGSPPERIRDLVEKDQLEKLKQELDEFIGESGLTARVTVSTEERGIVLSFQEDVLFELGSEKLTAQALEILDRVGPMLARTPNYIRVEGHTDDLPIHTARFPSNWELSAARATNVVQELIKNHGLPPQKMSATAYGEYRPRAPNDSEANRRLNRRVDLVILRSKFSEAEPQAWARLNQAAAEAAAVMSITTENSLHAPID